VVEGADAWVGDASTDGASTGEASKGGADRLAGDGLAHLQAAARELIKAARAVLDVAEELVDDPATVGTVAEAVGAVVHTAAQVGRRAVGQVMGDDGATDPDGDDAATGRRGGPTSGVERIRIG
jgi:hypothetical protein